jgi:hypothetical protein
MVKFEQATKQFNFWIKKIKAPSKEKSKIGGTNILFF